MVGHSDDPSLVLGRDGHDPISVPLPGGGRPDLFCVNELARLVLRARRAGYTVRLHGAPPELVELLALLGLHDVLAGSVEVGRQAEQLEQPGVEEVVVPDDPVG